jgi:hypothetical protein
MALVALRCNGRRPADNYYVESRRLPRRATSILEPLFCISERRSTASNQTSHQPSIYPVNTHQPTVRAISLPLH